MICQLEALLQDSFHMKDSGTIMYFLGLEVSHSPIGIFLHQHKYITNLIELACLQHYSPVDIPLEVNFDKTMVILHLIQLYIVA